MKNILIALPNDRIGGAELYLKNIARYYLKKGYSVYVIFLLTEKYRGWSDLKESDRAHLFFTNSNSEKLGLISFLRCIWMLKELSFDYIFSSHVHITGLLGFLVRLKILEKNFFIGRESTLIFERFSGINLVLLKFYIFLGYSELDLLICQTSVMEEQFIKNQPKLSKRIRIRTILNPVDIDVFGLDSNTESINYQNYIVAAGRLIPEKGFDLLIDAFSMLKLDFPHLNLVILGEGTCRRFLVNKVNQLGLVESVFLPGFKNNILQYFRDAKLCVVSSRIEGFPNVLLQMISQNNYVVSTKCAGGIEEIKGIFISETKSAEGIYLAMKDCLNFENIAMNRLSFDKELEGRTLNRFIDIVNYEVASKF